ncbi:hypothetical protein CRG98_028713 [Punica granatum]|uniref:Retrotransposon gag domain-containing protein n=1 Tax=Punica granatum TaxID=22663 RepID=A0A2I0J3S7_PUNGR|nr:hypothetical protein CRG98_028713 [Punica granatum]
MEEIDPPVPSGEVTPTNFSAVPITCYVCSTICPAIHVHAPTPMPPVSPSSNDAIHIAALKGTVNQMASNITDLMALLRGPNRASSSSIPPPAHGSMVDPSPWVPLTLAPESDVVPIPTPTHFPATVPSLTHTPEVYPVVAPFPVTLPATFPPPPMTVPIIDPAMLALPTMPVSATSLIHTAPMPTIFPATSTHAPAPITEPFPFPALQPQISLPHRTPSILNIPYYNLGAQAMVALEAPPTYILPAAETEYERRMKKMEEMMKALQESDSHYDTSYLDLNLFPVMRLPLKIKIPDLDKYDGTTDPKPHLQGYRNRMMPYWEYEQFMIQTFQESLKGAAVNWFTSLKAADIPTWDELAKKFEQSFEEYATQWRAEAAKHRPPIDEAEQIQIFHGTLKGAYYSDLLGHMSSFNTMIKAGKKVSLGIKLGRIDHPVRKGEGESSKKTVVTVASSHNRRSKDANVSVVNPGHPGHHQYAVNVAPSFPLPALQQQYLAQPIYYSAPPAYAPLQAPQQVVHHYAPVPQTQLRPPASRAHQPAQRAPAPQSQLDGTTQPRQCRPLFVPLPAPLSYIYRQLLAGNKIRLVAPGPNFDPMNQDHNLRCEYHQVKPPNVQINPLPDLGFSSGPTVNMIGAYLLGKNEAKEEDTLATDDERCVSSRFPENLSRTLFLYFDEGGVQRRGTPYKAEDEKNQANHSVLMQLSSSNTQRLQQRVPLKRHTLPRQQDMIGDDNRTKRLPRATSTNEDQGILVQHLH